MVFFWYLSNNSPMTVHWKVHWYCPIDSLSNQTVHQTVTGKLQPFSPIFTKFSGPKSDDSPAESSWTIWGSVKTSILPMIKWLQQVLNQLCYVHMSFCHAQFVIHDLQRVWLHLWTVLDYMEIFKPQMDGLAPPSWGVHDTVGCYTNSIWVAQDEHFTLPLVFCVESTWNGQTLYRLCIGWSDFVWTLHGMLRLCTNSTWNAQTPDRLHAEFYLFNLCFTFFFLSFGFQSVNITWNPQSVHGIFQVNFDNFDSAWNKSHFCSLFFVVFFL